MEDIYFYDSVYEQSLSEIKNSMFYTKEYLKTYEEFDERLEEPDLFGKSVMVSSHQFPKIYKIVCGICRDLNLEYIPTFVYEDFYYGVEAKGIRNVHIEISAKTIQDFTEDEIKFLIARELFLIKCGALNEKVIIEECLKNFDHFQIPMVHECVKDSFKLLSYRYLRSMHYSCDNFAYVYVGSMETAFQAIIKSILNNKALAAQVDFSEYMKQGNRINELVDKVSIFTKMDEKIPYGPFRMKNLLAYAISKYGIEARKDTRR